MFTAAYASARTAFASELEYRHVHAYSTPGDMGTDISDTEVRDATARTSLTIFVPVVFSHVTGQRNLSKHWARLHTFSQLSGHSSGTAVSSNSFTYHTQEKPFVCPHCEKTYPRRAVSLQRVLQIADPCPQFNEPQPAYPTSSQSRGPQPRSPADMKPAPAPKLSFNDKAARIPCLTPTTVQIIQNYRSFYWDG
ncbi:hypothetical protein BKA62DRAFT_761979 [Auriculariales sp. MPI-PUGE-AT-0066]|nr:hypothetical protein BKA62DRAFT_761979 [Auriculariales sp. MPI-PUGE-AT-0066]